MGEHGNGIPRKTNGSIDWKGWAGVLWPVIVTVTSALIGLLVWAEGRLESPEAKVQRVRSIATEIVSTHENSTGHSVMVERVKNLEQRYVEDVSEIKATLIRIEERLP